jgi:predicted acyltransferase
MNYLITARCDAGHGQVLTVAHRMGLAWAEVLAGLLDGSSSVYSYPPEPESVLNKCGICGARIQCTVTEESELRSDGQAGGLSHNG